MDRRIFLLSLLGLGLSSPGNARRSRRSSGTRRRSSSRSGRSYGAYGGGGGSSYYPNCSAARAAGAAPIMAGEPGYARKLDRDGDGVACE